MGISREEQRKAARDRARQNYDHRNEGGFSGKRVIDLAKIGGFKKDLFYRPREGVNHIDILPYVVKTDQHPQKVKQGYTDYLLDVWVHRRVGPSESTFLCLKKMFGKACPICEELEELRKDPHIDDDTVNAMRPKRRCWYNIINLDLPEREQEVQIFEEAHYLFEKELLEKAGSKKDDFVIFWDLEDGKSISFRATQKKSAKGPYFEYRIDDFEKRDSYSEKIFKETFSFDDMLVTPSYDEVRKAYCGIADDEEEEKEPEREERGSKRSRREEPESEEEKPSRRGRREDPDDEKPPKKSRRDEPEPEEEPEDDRRGRRRERESKHNPESDCPQGYKFGEDNDEHKECSECPKETWNKCADERDRLDKK